MRVPFFLNHESYMKRIILKCVPLDGWLIHIVACRPVARQQIPNTHQWTNWEAVVSTRPLRQLREAIVEELLGEEFSVPSVSRC
jgi:hypothetical protein